MNGPVVFVDKDGTLVRDVPYNVDPAKIRLAAGAAEGLSLLHDAGFRVAVVSNQSGVAHGYFAEDDLRIVETRLRQMLQEIDVSLAGFFYCPHHPKGKIVKYAIACDCRKPAPGLILAAARQLGCDLQRCWMIGDILDDVEAGRRAGCRTVLIDNGNETEWRSGRFREPHFRAADFATAARLIVDSAGSPKTELKSSNQKRLSDSG